jgi:predicted nucleic acid-binding protein
MRFWDSSAIIALLLPERNSAGLRDLAIQDSPTFVAWHTRVELSSALARRRRTGELTTSQAAVFEERCDALIDAWREVWPTDDLRAFARRMVRIHPLRAADAMQLASAWHACETCADSMEFVCLDERLREAAQREGFRLRPI